MSNFKITLSRMTLINLLCIQVAYRGGNPQLPFPVHV